ncbi:MAG: ABC transporter ATP-binding protein [Acetobacteraceae bacterium]
MSLLELRGVSRRFGAIEALHEISLSVEQGELRALIGPNGAGKTTLFNLVSGYFPPSEGTIHFQGKNISGIPPSRLVARGIVRTFQITEIFHDLTVYENLRVAVETAMGLTLRPFISRARRRQVDARIEELLETTGLSDRVDQVAGALALGDQRVVEMGITLTREPRLLLLDEPTAGMGDEETQRMVGVIRALHRERGITMLFIEHDMSIIFGVADRITVLDNGHMMAEGTPAEIAENENVQSAYLGRAQ